MSAAAPRYIAAAVAVWKDTPQDSAADLLDGAQTACERGDVSPDFTDIISVPAGGEVMILGVTSAERVAVQQLVEQLRAGTAAPQP